MDNQIQLDYVNFPSLQNSRQTEAPEPPLFFFKEHIKEQNGMIPVEQEEEPEDEEDKNLNSQIFVGAIHPEATHEEVEAYFSQFGKIQDVKLMRDKITSKNLLFLF